MRLVGLVLVWAERVRRPRRAVRRARLIEELDEAEVAEIAKAQVPPGHEHLDALLDD
jgi:hypothetical protein